MKIAVRIAQAGNQILNIIVMGIILFLFLYGGYSLWDTYMSAKSAFLSVPFPSLFILYVYGFFMPLCDFF